MTVLWCGQSSEEGVKGDDRTWELAVNVQKILIAGGIHFADYRELEANLASMAPPDE